MSDERRLSIASNSSSDSLKSTEQLITLLKNETDKSFNETDNSESTIDEVKLLVNLDNQQTQILPKSKKIKFTVRKPSDPPKNHFKHLQRDYDNYNLRIEKINKEIDFLLGLLPPYNVEIDYKTRTKVNNAIEKLKNKQDELEKKKYDLGIVILRQWRNLDEGDLWVRSSRG